MMPGRVVFDCLITFAGVHVNHNLYQGRQFVEQAMAHFFSDEMTLQGGQLAIHGDMHFAI